MMNSEISPYVFLLLTLVLSLNASAADPCKPEKLAVYKVVLETFWSQDKFPKQYPEFRPHAQWSKVLGRSHNDLYSIWRLEQEASEGVKMFAETGKTDIFDSESQGAGGIYDEFFAPPINAGVGKTDTHFFVDGNHSKVSLIGRIVPSPDWFVGVDSFDLCVQGKWVDAVTMDVDPMDAGTDNGFTFTAPNWATVPQEKITRITSQNPDHPANSFFYPHLKKLPTIATFTFYKLKEFELSQTYNFDKSSIQTLKYVVNDQPVNTVQSLTPTTTHNQKVNREPGFRPPNPITNTISDSLVSRNPKLGHKNTSKITRNFPKQRGPRPCRVTDWSEWSACSKTCSIGEQQRTRTIVKHPRRGGTPCPNLIERQWCGSAGNCRTSQKNYFTW